MKKKIKLEVLNSYHANNHGADHENGDINSGM
ncbi:dachshund c, partial [Tachysurus ichikawai]